MMIGRVATMVAAMRMLSGVTVEDRATPIGSSDVGNVTHVIPVIQPMIRISETPVAGHSVEKREACRSEMGLRSIALGAKALALTALDLLEQPEVLARIKADHAALLAQETQNSK